MSPPQAFISLFRRGYLSRRFFPLQISLSRPRLMLQAGGDRKGESTRSSRCCKRKGVNSTSSQRFSGVPERRRKKGRPLRARACHLCPPLQEASLAPAGVRATRAWCG
uniref:Uncharacterized protein n=1 Tax=Setaria viridis TaxID=4556 RepID=A0A4U6V4A9_SETVI|nr:hypothetical protein SEVIR_4G215300v2 [Setaria viridis]